VRTSLFRHRRIERFAQLIGEATGTRRHRGLADIDLHDMAALTQRVCQLPVDAAPHQEFRDGLRATLMATIEREGIGATAEQTDTEQRSQRGPADPRRFKVQVRALSAAAACVVAGALALSGMSAASGNAIPGDALYGVKRSTERAQLAFSGSDLARGLLFLEFAKTRLDEAWAVRDATEDLAVALGDMDEETRQGIVLLTSAAVDTRDPAALDAIDLFVSSQRRALARLREGLPSPLSAATRSRVELSAQLLDRVRSRSTGLRPLLACTTPAVENSDDLGPRLSGHCPPAQANSSQPTLLPSSDSGPSTPRTGPQSASPVPSISVGAGSSTASSSSSNGSPDAGPAEPAEPSAAPTMSEEQSSNLEGTIKDVLGGIGRR